MKAEEKKWRAEGDARTLADAIAITNDAERVKSAKGAAKRMVKDENKYAKEVQARAGALGRVAKQDYSKAFTKEHGGKK